MSTIGTKDRPGEVNKGDVNQQEYHTKDILKVGGWFERVDKIGEIKKESSNSSSAKGKIPESSNKSKEESNKSKENLMKLTKEIEELKDRIKDKKEKLESGNITPIPLSHLRAYITETEGPNAFDKFRPILKNVAFYGGDVENRVDLSTEQKKLINEYVEYLSSVAEKIQHANLNDVEKYLNHLEKEYKKIPNSNGNKKKEYEENIRKTKSFLEAGRALAKANITDKDAFIKYISVPRVEKEAEENTKNYKELRKMEQRLGALEEKLSKYSIGNLSKDDVKTLIEYIKKDQKDFNKLDPKSVAVHERTQRTLKWVVYQTTVLKNDKYLQILQNFVESNGVLSNGTYYLPSLLTERQQTLLEFVMLKEYCNDIKRDKDSKEDFVIDGVRDSIKNYIELVGRLVGRIGTADLKSYLKSVGTGNPDPQMLEDLHALEDLEEKILHGYALITAVELRKDGSLRNTVKKIPKLSEKIELLSELNDTIMNDKIISVAKDILDAYIDIQFNKIINNQNLKIREVEAIPFNNKKI